MKPVNTTGMYCPLYRAKTSKCCHTCEMWQPINAMREGKTTIEWSCGFNTTWKAVVIMNARIDRMAATQEMLRNSFERFHRSIMRLVSMLTGVPLQPPSIEAKVEPEK